MISAGHYSRHQTAPGMGLVLILAICSATAAGYVFDGAGQFTWGFWAATSGGGVGLLGVSIMAAIDRWRSARLLAALMAAGAAITGGMLLLFTGPFQLSPVSLEGLWVYPLALGLLVMSGFAFRRAITG